MKTQTKKQHKCEFFCDTCDTKQSMNFDALKEHLKNHHQITEGLNGLKQGISFIDGSDGYANTYEWTLENGIKITEVASGPRGGMFGPGE